MGAATWQAGWVWEITGWVLCALGVAAIVWALLWDRARGRKRCPKCWYDLGGAAKAGAVAGEAICVCPECGRKVMHERQMLRTRRRWVWVGIGLVAMVAGDAAWSVPQSARTGWAAFVPGLALLAFVPGDPPPAGMPLTRGSAEVNWWCEVYHRYGGDEAVLKPMWGLSRRVLAFGAARAVRNSTTDRGRYGAAFVLGQVDTRAPERFEGATRALVIGACSDAAYAACSSYEDVALHKGNIGGRDETLSYTALERPKRFRFEYLSAHPFQTKFSIRGDIWQDGGKVNKWWSIQPKTEEWPDASMPIAGFTGVSSSLANTVPMRLLSQSRGGLGKTELIGDDVCDERPCYRIRQTLGQWVEDLWIDKGTYGILRIERPGPFFDITVYRPRFNGGCAAGAFAFDPAKPKETPLGDGEKTSERLRGLLGKRRSDEGKQKKGGE